MCEAYCIRQRHEHAQQHRKHPPMIEQNTRERTRIMLGISAAAFLGPFTQTMYVPSLVEVGHHLHVSPFLVNLTISIYTAILAVSSFVMGPLADSRGRRRVLIGGLLVFVAGSLLCLVAQSYGAFFLGRILQALGISAGSVVAAAVIGDIYPPEERAHAMSHYQLLVYLGPVFGPVVGGLIASYLHWWWAFGVLVAAGILTALYNARHLPETLNHEHLASPLTLAGIHAVVANRSARSILLTGFSQFYGYYLFLVFLPLLTGEFGLSTVAKGLVFVPLTAGIVIGISVAKRWFSHWPRTRAVRLSSYGVAIGVLLLCLLLITHRLSIPWLTVLLLAYGMLLGGSLPAQSTILVNLFHAERATAVGVYNFTRFMGAAAGPLLGAMIAAAFGIPAVFLSLGLLLFASGWVLQRRVYDPHEQEETAEEIDEPGI